MGYSGTIPIPRSPHGEEFCLEDDIDMGR